LEELYGFDNQAFLSWLSERGFYVAEQGASNYAQTYLSLASSLNMQYLDEISSVMGESDSRAPLAYLIRNNSVAKILRESGYKFIFVPSGYDVSATDDSPQADICYCEDYGLNNIERAVFTLTPLTLLSPESINPYVSHRRKVLVGFDHITNMPQFDEPIFVFAHILAPHPPFVFGPNGEEVKQHLLFTLLDGSQFPASHEEYVTGYREQTTYINTKLSEAVDAILERSTTPPIIILQADHGPGSMLDWDSAEHTNMKERLSIFAAYYLPDDASQQMPANMTPVNTFRILFNSYFGADFELLENKSYFSEWETPYDFMRVIPEELE
jgi:hypothetical protein